MFEVMPIKGKGCGLVARVAFNEGDELMRGPILTFPPGTTDGTPFFDLCWWADGQEHLTLAAHTLCNHSVNPNCECKTENGWDILLAKRAIYIGDELTLDYREFDK